MDASLRVLDAGGQPIEGLIAAGTDAESGLYSPKKAYVTYGGSAAGWAWTSGYLAGRDSRRIGQRRVSAVLKEFTK